MKPVKQDLKNQKKKHVSKLNLAVRYSGLAFEMAFVILAGVFGGIKLDEWLNSSPAFTVGLALVSVFVAIYISVKDLLRKND